jgi:hypothetical protein
MNEPIVKRGGEVISPAEVAEKDALMPSINAAIVASMRGEAQ